MPDPFLVLLVSKLVPAVSKALVKLWIGKDDLPNSFAGGTIDALAAKCLTGKDLPQKTVGRLANDVAIRVAGALGGSESGLKPDELEQTLLAAADTLGNAEVDLRDLLRMSLDPVDFRAELRDAGIRLRRDLSPRQQSLYDRILAETVKQLLPRVEELPSFASLESAEMLQRLERLASDLDPIRNYLKGVDAASSQFELRYREAVERALDRMELFGIDVPAEARKYPLTLAYVRISLSDTLKTGTPRPAEEALGGWQRTIVRGRAGSGKTTLLNWLAVRSAKGDFSGALESWNGTVPFFIRLRSLVDADKQAHLTLPNPEEFPRRLSPVVAGAMPPGWVDLQLQEGRALVLIDGVDEVPHQLRSKVRDWVQELCAAFPRARYVVSSREELEPGWLKKSAFEECSIAPLATDDAYTLIDRWYAAVPPANDDLEESAAVKAERLKAELRENVPVRRLTDTPVLCGMICALYRERHGRLPTTRVGIYRACCEALLHRREAERDIQVSAALKSLDLDAKQLLIDELAYWMMRNGLSEAPVKDVDEQLEQRIRRMPHRHPELTGAIIREFFVKRSALLREPVVGKVDFAHKTFMEYLTAKAIVEHNDIQYLIDQGHRDEWHETIKLAAGLTRGSRAEALVKGLLQRGDRSLRSGARHRYHLLAAACLELSRDLDPTLVSEVEKRVAKLVPPKDERAARLLAEVGAIVIPHLRPRKEFNEREAAACVSALLYVLSKSSKDEPGSSDEVLNVLADYARDPRDGVVKAVEAGWDRIATSDEYLHRVMAIVWCHRSALRLGDFGRGLAIRDVGPLAGLSALQSLDLSGCEAIHDLGPLAGLTALQSLDLTGCKAIQDLGPLAGLSALQSLDLRGCAAIRDLGPLVGLSALQSLDLRGCAAIHDLGPLAGLSALQSLRLARCIGIQDLGPLAGLSALQSLGLEGCAAIQDLGPLSGLSALQYLSLWGCAAIRDLGPLAGLTALQSLSLWGCAAIWDVGPLSGLTALKSLSLWDCAAIHDLGPLSGLMRLQSLSLAKCVGIQDLGPLSGLSALQSLKLNGCAAIRDVGPLSGLSALQSLSLWDCAAIRDVGPLSGLSALKSLRLTNCTSIQDLGPLSGLSALRSLDLTGCSELDLRPVAHVSRLRVNGKSARERIFIRVGFKS